jgi:hypothetical protein
LGKLFDIEQSRFEKPKRNQKLQSRKETRRKKVGKVNKAASPVHKLRFCAEIQAIFQSFYKGATVLCER